MLNAPGQPALARMSTGTLTSVCYNSTVQNSRALGPLICGKEIVKAAIASESAGAITLSPATPTSVVMTASGAANVNAAGSQRGYKINVKNYAYLLYPQNYPPMNAVQWARQQVAVSAYHDLERFSSMGVYDQQTPADPCLKFLDYLNNNESLVDADLVAWVTIGGHHIPTAEDAPTTATPGHRISFLLQPYNFFDADPSMDASDAVFVSIGEDATGATTHTYETYGTDQSGSACVPASGAAEDWTAWKGEMGGTGALGRRRSRLRRSR